MQPVKLSLFGFVIGYGKQLKVNWKLKAKIFRFNLELRSMDRISKSLLDEFSRAHDLEGFEEDSRFEHFASFLALHRFHGENFDTSEVVIGSSGDTGIDAIGIIANGSIVTDPDTVEELADRNGYLDVIFVFVQSERSPAFESAKIGQLGFGVEDFFREKPQLPRSERVKEAGEVMAEIYKRSGLFRRGNPVCWLFYVTTGKWVDDKQLVARKDGVIADLKATNLFRDVHFEPIDADDIQKIYRQTKNAVSRDFNFAVKTVMPEIPGVSEAYLGLLPAPDFLSLIQDDNGELMKAIFYDNVRDWQDYNRINSGIRDTVTDSGLRPRFVLMNNGVTIIAKTLRATGNRFHIEDYQVVNGCQTSHVLDDQQNHLDETIMIQFVLLPPKTRMLFDQSLPQPIGRRR